METKTEEILSETKISLKDKSFKKISLDYNDVPEDYPFLSDSLTDLVTEKLKAVRGVKSVERVRVNYDLSYSQGSFFSFEGKILFKGLDFEIVTRGRGYSLSYNIFSFKDKYLDELPEKTTDKAHAIAEEFLEIAKTINKEMMNEGYSWIESDNEDYILRAGLQIFIEQNNLSIDIDWFNYSSEKKKGFICLSEKSNTNFELWVKPFDLLKVRKRVLKAETVEETGFKGVD